MRRTVVALVSGLLLVAALAPFASATSGTLNITTDTTLTEDHYGQIVVAADDVTLDCAGHRVIGASIEDAVGVLLDGRTGVTVKNCHVAGGFAVGFAVVGESTGNTLSGNVATGVGEGFDVSGGPSDNTLSGNVATGYGDNGFSLVDGANNNTLTGNSASGGDHGFWVLDVSGNVLADNQAYGNATNFQLGNGAGTSTTGNTLIRNTSSWSRDSGFNLAGADGNTLSNNTATHNGYCGFEAQWGSYNTFTHNAATNNAQGFCVNMNEGSGGIVGPRPIGNTFTRNAANHNRDYGFALWEGSSENVVDSSVARNNGIYDAVDFSAPGSNTWTNDNFGTTDPAGIG